MSSREAAKCALKCFILQEKYALQWECTMCRRQLLRWALKSEGQEPKSSPSGLYLNLLEACWGYLYTQLAQLIERRKAWIGGPNQNFRGWWICVHSSSLVLITNTLLFNGILAIQFKRLCENGGENCGINFILPNRIQDKAVSQGGGLCMLPQLCSGTDRSVPILF